MPRVTTTDVLARVTVARLLELVGLHDDDEDAASAAGGTTGAAERAPPVCTVHDGSAAGGAPGSSSADGPPTGRGAQGAQGGGSRRNALWRSWTSDGLTETDGGSGRSGASFWTAADGVTAFKTINDAEVTLLTMSRWRRCTT